ncbi:MAG: S1 family peptidase [Actinomycetia bacterium]|nr:S1 family peptidase [Actinomycetes bacterium]
MAAPSGDGSYTDPSGLTVITQTAQVPPDLAEVYAAALMAAENQPEDFGYPHVKDGTVVLPAVSATATALSKADRKAAAKQLREYAKRLKKDGAAAYDPSVDVTSLINLAASPGKRNAKKIDELNNAVFDARNDTSLKGGQIVSTGIDASGRVVVTLKRLTPGVASSLAKKYGVDDIAIRVQPDFRASATWSRASDVSRYGGGAAIRIHISNTVTGICSDAFSWYYGTAYMMLTAGHCIPNGGDVYAPDGTDMGFVTSGSKESWNAGTGTVLMTGQATYRGDIAIIQLYAPLKSNNVIYRGGPTSTTLSNVVEMWSRSSNFGDQFCTGGQTTGEICGWVVDQVAVNLDYYNADTGAFEGTIRHAVSGSRAGNVGTKGGDSGGSVFTVRSDGQIAAKGVISGSGAIKLGGLTPSTTVYFTDIWDAYYGFLGYLRTTSA